MKQIIYPNPRTNPQRGMIAGLATLIGLLIAGYVMIGLLVLINDSMNKINDKMDNAEIMVCNTRMDLSQFSK